MTTFPRTGWGFDAHRVGGLGPMRLCGVVVAAETGLEGTSDADVGTHAVIDAILGAAALGDIGELFPSSDPTWAGADSVELLGIARGRVEAAGFRIASIDITIVAEHVRVAPHRSTMRDVLSRALGVPRSSVSVKATSTDGLGWIGRGEGVGAAAVATLIHA